MNSNTLNMDMGWEVLKEWLIAVLALVFGSKLVADWFQHRRESRRENVNVHVTNKSAEIDADQKAMELLFNRVNYHEAEISKLRDELRVEAVTNARLSAENQNLLRENVRQQSEIDTLKADILSRDRQIDTLSRQVRDLTKRIEEVQHISERPADSV